MSATAWLAREQCCNSFRRQDETWNEIFFHVATFLPFSHGPASIPTRPDIICSASQVFQSAVLRLDAMSAVRSHSSREREDGTSGASRGVCIAARMCSCTFAKGASIANL